MADRIHDLRKAKGISQEELADKIGVSRQAVSKWESEQSAPDLEKIISMSEYFNVTTDYLLKGIEPVADDDKKSSELTGKILVIAAVTLIAIGLFCAFAGWYEQQSMDAVWGSLIIQAVGVAGYFIGRLLSPVKPPIAANRLILAGVLWIPVSMLSGAISVALFKQGWVAPYPIGLWQIALFSALYAGLCATGFILLGRRNKRPI